MNNLKNKIRRAPRQLARRISARGCEPSSLRLSSKLFRLFSTTTDENLVFNDALGTTVGSKSNGKYSAAALTAFGEDLSVNSSGESSRSPFPVPHSPFFTGKPFVEGLGHAFLMRNYRASLSKWQTADPLGYPDGWNQLAYCGNACVSYVDYLGFSKATWAYYESVTAETNSNWENYASVHNSECPVRGEKYECCVDHEVLVNTKDYGVREIDGHQYHVYQDYLYDVYATEVYGATDPLGAFRKELAAAGIGAGLVGLVVAFSNPAIGMSVTVGGIVVSTAGMWEPDLEFLVEAYRIHPETLVIKYRKELIE